MDANVQWRPRPIAGECRTPMRLRLFAAALVLTFPHAPPAEACGNVTREEVDAGGPERAPQATMMLRSLATKDLIGSAHAYAALAHLEKQAGDTEAEKRARDKCRTMTKRPAICGTTTTTS